MTDRMIRASDQERESVVDILRDAFTDGRLTFDEFEERTAAAYAAKTWAQLRELTSDLPAQPELGTDLSTDLDIDLGDRPQAPVPRLVPAPVRPHRSGGGRPFDRLLPVLCVWILISAAAGSLDLVAALCIVFVFALAFRIGSGGRR